MTTKYLVLFGTLVVLVSNFNCGFTFDILHEHLHNVDKSDIDKLDIAQTGQPTEELCQFWGPFGAIQITDQSLISSNWSLIEFKLKVRTKETIFRVELRNTAETRGYFKPKPTFAITPQMETFGSFHYNQIAYDAILHQVNISTRPPQVAFTVWDIKVDHKTRITKRQVTLNYHWELQGASSIASTYLVKSSQIGQAYIKYTFDDLENSSPNREYCFQLAKTSHPQMVIEVYANLFGVNQFKKLYTYSVTKLSDIFCLSSSIYLRKLGRFEISFVFNGRVTGEDGMLINFICTRIPSNSLPSTRMSPKYENANWESLRTVWWYNNPRLFGYTIVSNASRMAWYACDIISNCYRYERKGKFVIETSETQWDDNYNEVQIKHSQTVWNYTLPQVAKQLLSHSPLIRVYNDDQDAIIFRETHYLRDRSQMLASSCTSLSARNAIMQLLVLGTLFDKNGAQNKIPRI